MIKHKYKTKLLNFDLIAEKLDLNEGDLVADFGCGRSGAFSFWAASQVGDKGLVYAIDIIKDNLYLIAKEQKENNIKNIETLWHDLEHSIGTKINSSSLDNIIVANVLHQTKNPDNVLAEANRILKPGGKILILDWLKIANPAGPEMRVDKVSLKDFAESLGLRLVSDFLPGDYHFALIFKK